MAQDLAGEVRPPGEDKLTPTNALGTAFTADQKQYLEGFLRGLVAQSETASPANTASDAPAVDVSQLPPGKEAQLAWLASGKRLSKEEKIKFDADPLDAWPRIAELSALGKLPEGEDIFRFKTHGLWNVSPAQESMMSRLRFPAGYVRAYQAEAVAAAAEAYGGGYVDITTRANLQIREIPGKHMASLLTDLHEAGIIPRGSGADNIRNVTGNPTCGIDAGEFYDVLPLCRQLHHHILHDRSLYGLPRKFNVAFDGGNSISTLEDTNDIGLKAVRVEADRAAANGIAEGVYFRVALGGITGHGDLARDTGLLLLPEECIPVISAMIRVYVMNGDRGNRKRARLKYVLDSWGFEKFLAETQKSLPFPLRRLPAAECRFAAPVDKGGHLGIHPQRQPGLCYLGVDVPVGRLSVPQLRGLAALSTIFGSGTLRLTVWQNLLISDIPAERMDAAVQALEELGLTHEPDPIQAGLVACTGSEGCKFGMAPTKSTALAISSHLRGLRDRLALDAPVNIHLTGCAHSCAQHFIGDIGLIAASVDTEAYKGPGFHVFIGGGYGPEGRMAAPARRSVPVAQVPAEIERILSLYLGNRRSRETFTAFTMRLTDAEITALFTDDSAGESILAINGAAATASTEKR
ncbi:MAG: NirA family protein [Fibrobacteria bacterium]